MPGKADKHAAAETVAEAMPSYGAAIGLISAMVAALVAAAAPRRVVLFGSHATGLVGPHSDIDLMVVEDEPFGKDKSRYKEAARLQRALRAFSAPKDVLVFSTAEWAMHGDDPTHVIGQARQHGQVLYEQA